MTRTGCRGPPPSTQNEWEINHIWIYGEKTAVGGKTIDESCPRGNNAAIAVIMASHVIVIHERTV
jgi:hypothetical protein